MSLMFKSFRSLPQHALKLSQPLLLTCVLFLETRVLLAVFLKFTLVNGNTAVQKSLLALQGGLEK
jgi:hypothetical protein